MSTTPRETLKHTHDTHWLPFIADLGVKLISKITPIIWSIETKNKLHINKTINAHKLIYSYRYSMEQKVSE